MPWRRAVDDTSRGPVKPSATILSFSSSDQCRLRPVSNHFQPTDLRAVRKISHTHCLQRSTSLWQRGSRRRLLFRIRHWRAARAPGSPSLRSRRSSRLLADWLRLRSSSDVGSHLCNIVETNASSPRMVIGPASIPARERGTLWTRARCALEGRVSFAVGNAGTCLSRTGASMSATSHLESVTCCGSISCSQSSFACCGLAAVLPVSNHPASTGPGFRRVGFPHVDWRSGRTGSRVAARSRRDP